MNAASVHAADAGRAGRREWIGLGVLALPSMLISMDLTVLHLAVPALSAALNPGSAQLLWIVDIYGFMVAGCLITMGTLGDRIGRRRLLLIGAAGFALASVLAAFSTSAEMLIATRALLGIAGATLMPSTMSLLRTMFPEPGQRTVAIGIWISSFSVGAAIGPLVGGALLTYFWWGSVFLLGVPVMALLLTLGPLLLPEYRDPNAGRLDVLSAALSLASVLLVIFGVKQTAAHGLDALSALAVLAGLVAGAVFVARQRTLADPLIDLALFANRKFTASLTTNTVGIFAMFGVYQFIPQYVQLVVGLSPFAAGLWTLPGAVTSVAGSMLAPVLVRRARPAVVVCAGLTVVVVSFLLLTQVGPESLLLMVTAETLMMIGFGVVVTITSDMIIGAASPERAGAASAISETSNELGGALGIAILGSIGTAIYRHDVAAALPAGIPLDAATAAQDTLGGAVSVVGHVADHLGLTVLIAAREAFVHGIQVVSICGTIMTIGLVILVALWLRDLGATSDTEASAYAEPEGLVA
jgi:DHA2 family multidrug resistance protein-like MFS transporter